MQSQEFCVYNETRENVLTSRVTVIDTKADPLKAVKALIEGLGSHQEAGLWLNPLKSVPTVPTLSAYDLVYLDQDCRVVHSVAMIPDNDVPQFIGEASSALLLPLHTFTASQTHRGDRFLICTPDQIEHRHTPIPVPIPSASTPPSSHSVPLQSVCDSSIHPRLSGAGSTQPETATLHFEPQDKQDKVETEDSGSNASKVGFLRGLVHLRVHISISMAPRPHATPDAKPAGAPAAQWSGNFFWRAPAQWSKQRAAFKTRVLRPINDFFQRRVRPTVAAFSPRIVKTTRSGAARATAQARSLKLRYLRWADKFIFPPARTSAQADAISTTAPADQRLSFQRRGQRWLQTRLFR